MNTSSKNIQINFDNSLKKG